VFQFRKRSEPSSANAIATIMTKTAVRPPAIGIGKLLRRAHMAFSRELRLRLAAHDVSFGEFIHLEKLWYEDGLNQTEISRRVGIETASSTAILDLLERRGFVRRVRNGSDRRNINVFLNPPGEKLRDRLLGCAKAVNLIARRGLKEREVLTFFALMTKIADNVEKASSNRGAARRKRSAGRASARRGRNNATPTKDNRPRI
jgi:MarR family transcriptional regulator for hemolysin